MSTTTPATGLEAEIRRIVREELAQARATRALESYDQRPDHRPPWAKSPKFYLARWRELRSEGHPGATIAGRLRLISREASEEVARRLNARARTRRNSKPVTGPSLLERLGAVRAS